MAIKLLGVRPMVSWSTTPTGLRRAVVGDVIYTIKPHLSRKGNKSRTPGRLYRNGWMIWVKEDRQIEFPWKWVSTLRAADSILREEVKH